MATTRATTLPAGETATDTSIERWDTSDLVFVKQENVGTNGVKALYRFASQLDLEHEATTLQLELYQNGQSRDPRSLSVRFIATLGFFVETIVGSEEPFYEPAEIKLTLVYPGTQLRTTDELIAGLGQLVQALSPGNADGEALENSLLNVISSGRVSDLFSS